MKPELRREILAETYEDVKLLIFGAVWKFCGGYGGNVDDLISQANLIFIDAFDSYDPSKGAKFTTWLTWKIKKGLLDYMRKERVYVTDIHISNEFIEEYPALDRSFSVMELLDEMGQDAYIVLQLFFETPRDVMANIVNNYNRADHAQTAMRNRLQNRLRQMGWTMRRTKKAFEQLKEITSY